MRALAVVGLLILLGALAYLWWGFAVGGETAVPGAPLGAASTSARANDLAEASAVVPAAPGERDTTARTAVEADLPRTAAADARFALVGRVVDEHGGPIEKAVVTATPSDWYESFGFQELASGDAQQTRDRVQRVLQATRDGQTDAEGRFRIAGAGPSDRVDLRVQARGWVTLRRTAERPVQADVQLGDLTLVRGAVVSGRVVDGSGQPVVAARVARTDRNEGPWGFGLESPGGDPFRELQRGDEVVTGDDGAFELPNVQAGEFALRVSHREHPPVRRADLTVAAGAELADVLVIMPPGASISGRVAGLPEGATVHALAALGPAEWSKEGDEQFLRGMFAADFPPPFGQRVAPVAADGTFELGGLAAGRSYRVWAVQERGGAGRGAVACCAALEAPSGSQGLVLRYDGGVTVTGRVVDARSGQAIEDVWVHRQLVGDTGGNDYAFFGRSDAEHVVCADGRMTIGNLRPQPKQTLTLRVGAVGHAPYTRENIALPITGVLDVGDVRLEPKPVVRVLVTAGAAGAPLAGATVRLQEVKGGDGVRELQPERGRGRPDDPAPLTGKTDEAGRCVLNRGSGADVRLHVTASDLAPFASEVLALPEDADLDYHAQLVPGGIVQVTAQDEEGAVLTGVSIRHRAPSGETTSKRVDAGGRVTFPLLAPGQHGFRIGSDRGFERFGPQSGGEAGSDEAGWQPVEVADGGSYELKVIQEPQVLLSGTVRENGLPLADARVAFVRGTGTEADAQGDLLRREFEAGARSVKTDAQGHYELKGLAAGEHRLQVSHESRAMTATVPVRLQIGANVDDVDLTTAMLRGVVRDPAGKPIAGASVRITAPAGNRFVNRSQRASESGADGRYEVRGVQDGVELVVRARAKGYAEAAAPAVRVAAGVTRDNVDVTLAAAGRIEVRTAAEGRPRVFARREGGDARDAPSASAVAKEGTAVLEDLLPGRWRVMIRGTPAGQTFEPVFVEVEAGKTGVVRF
ncbi:MAG TPA: carboxypeptidase-like regulatory domain-containing protein [Planctomycetota bacterium]|nr:carboxypeptidase-like regulatory domain-containing protein [Planctomycetota bacterium]